MSFCGYGPLGAFGWGTTTLQALDQQSSHVVKQYHATAQLLSGSQDGTSAATSSPLPPFPSLEGVLLRDGGGGSSNLLNLTAGAEAGVFPAAVFTDNAAENQPYERRRDIHQRKREFNDLPKDLRESQLAFERAALASLQHRHAAMEALPVAQQAILQQAAQWICSVAVNVYIRELLLYPLIRDQLDGGLHFYQQSLKQNDQLRETMRDIRSTVYKNATDTTWQGKVSSVQQKWLADWEQERKEWLPQLSAYLLRVQVSRLRDICANQEQPNIPEPEPPTSHDLSYGQQIVQMWQILNANMLKTGNMQGIPRPRYDEDWSLPDGFEPAHDLTYGAPPEERGRFPASTGLIATPVPFVSISDPDPKTSTALPPTRPPSDPATAATYLPWGASLTRLVKLPNASSEDARTAVDKAISDTADASKKAHRRAALQHYGSEEAEDLATRKALIASAAEKATALNEFLTEKNHTSDLSGSYYYDEVTLAFRNHGTHWETLSEDITPLGEHYLLIHYDVQYYTRLDKYRLKVHGCVERPLTLTLHQVKELGKDHMWTQPMVMECSGNGRAMMKPRYNKHVPWGLQAFGCYTWSGLPLRLLLQQVGVTSDCVDVVFTGHDAGMEHNELRYFQHSIAINDPIIDSSMLCWMHNGVPLIPNHGYPLRLMVPAWYGNANVKWLQSIELVNRRFTGVYQRTYSYSKTNSDNDIACPSQEQRPHAVVKPMGYPDFTTRKRTAIAGKQTWVGKAWVGGGTYRAVIWVELSLDAGKTWLPCKLAPRLGIFGWHRFEVEVDLAVGMYTVSARATDNIGNRQTVELDSWNYASMQDDAIQSIQLIVVDELKVTE